MGHYFMVKQSVCQEDHNTKFMNKNKRKRGKIKTKEEKSGEGKGENTNFKICELKSDRGGTHL